MDKIVGWIGRDEVVADLVTEIPKGKRVILTEPIGVGKSVVLKAALDRLGARLSVGVENFPAFKPIRRLIFFNSLANIFRMI